MRCVQEEAACLLLQGKNRRDNETLEEKTAAIAVHLSKSTDRTSSGSRPAPIAVSPVAVMATSAQLPSLVQQRESAVRS